MNGNTSCLHARYVSYIAITSIGTYNYLQECTPNNADILARRQIINQLTKFVKSGLCNHTGMHIEPYGSFQSNLHFACGDLDLTIEGSYIPVYVSHTVCMLSYIWVQGDLASERNCIPPSFLLDFGAYPMHACLAVVQQLCSCASGADTVMPYAR